MHLPVYRGRQMHYGTPNANKETQPMSKVIDFRTDPSKYRHWKVEYDGPVATVYMDVDENGGLF